MTAKTVPTGAKTLGNTKTRVNPARNWCFTWFLEEELADGSIGSIIKDPKVHRYVIGKEICPTTGRFHLQGYLQFKKKLRPLGLWNNTIHWELAQGDEWENLVYCTKEDKYVQNIQQKIKDPMAGLTPYWWQQEIIELLKIEADLRSIHWYWEPTGNVGKTVFQKSICINNSDVLIVGGKSADVKYAISEYVKSKNSGPKAVIWNFVRTQENYISYESIEAVKDGIFFSTKFESGQCIYNSPHVIIFANVEPDKSALSNDRWNIVRIQSKKSKSSYANVPPSSTVGVGSTFSLTSLYPTVSGGGSLNEEDFSTLD